MQEYDEILVQNCLRKSHQALSDARYLIEDSRKSVALNRLYYSIFYAVQGLAYRNKFVTSKHSALMGWFNRKFVHEEKIFTKQIYEVYKNAFLNRQEADYELLNASEFSIVQLNDLLLQSQDFVATIEKHLSN